MARRSQRRPQHPDPFDPLDGQPDMEIDLHGLTAAEARVRVEHGLKRARGQFPGGLIHIITGKGRNSAGPPVLRGLVRTVLTSGTHPEVADWGRDTHEGGYLVRLKGGRW